MTEEDQAHVQSRNPAPRPALRRTDGTAGHGVSVLRPGLSPAEQGNSDPTPARATGGTGSTGVGEASRRKGPKKTRDDSDARGKGSKAGRGKKKSKSHDAPSGKELVVALPKPVRKALAEAATRHGTTPERLAALVLSEWIDH